MYNVERRGMQYDAMYETWSEIRFCMSGIMPPPTTIIMNIPDASAVYLPNPSTERLNMHDHITEVHNPQSIRSKAAIGRLSTANALPVNTGIAKVILLPDIIAVNVNNEAMDAVAVSILRLEILSAIIPPKNLPTSIRNQYVAATNPAAAVASPNPEPPPLAVVSER